MRIYKNDCRGEHMPIRYEYTEENYRFIFRMRKVARTLPIYGAHVDVDKKIDFLIKMGLDDVDVWIGEQYDGKIPIRDCSIGDINDLVIAVDAEMRAYILKYQEMRRNKKPRQGKFEFPGAMGDVRRPENMQNELNARDAFRRRTM